MKNKAKNLRKSRGIINTCILYKNINSYFYIVVLQMRNGSYIFILNHINSYQMLEKTIKIWYNINLKNIYLRR